MSPLRWGFLTFVGMLFAQAAWMLAVPPYQAIDEFDHVYRAAGVATGQWRLSEDTPNGRGLGVVVPKDIVEAASDQCDALAYTRPDNCFPVESRGDGNVLISTGAGSYHPAYYWVTGMAARPFEGDAANYAMRIASALISAIGVAFAAYCVGLLRAGPWTRLGFIASLTPVLIYTTIIPAPNAWEIVAGLCLWTTLLALFTASPDPRGARLLVGAATVSAVVLVTPRMLGPMWLGLIVVVLACYVGPTEVLKVLRRNPLSWIIGSAVVTAATLASAWWILSAELTEPPAELEPREVPFAMVALKPLTWTLGTVGAFPFRDQPAPIPTYVMYFVVVVTMLWVGIRHAVRRERAAILGAVSLTMVVPATLTFLTLEERGTMWQGRYGLPFVVGILLLAGLVLDRKDWARSERVRLIPLGLLLMGAAQVWCVWHVVNWQVGRVETVPSPSWVPLPGPLIGGLMAFGWLMLASAPLLSLRTPTAVEADLEHAGQTAPW